MTQLIQEQKRKYQWAVNVYMMKVLSTMAKVLNIKKVEEVRKMKTRFAVDMFIIKFKRFQSKKKKTLEERHRQVLRM